MDRALNIAVFGSGRGSNFQSILTAIREGKLPGATVRVVISNNSTAGILEIARANGIPAEHISAKQFSRDEKFVAALLAKLRTHGVNFIVLAGYMKRIPAEIIREFSNRILNIHPALLPKFGGHGMYGIHVHEAVIRAGEKFSGATVHIVDEEYDQGPVVLQKKIALDPGETPDSLAAKVLKIEHELYPEALRLFTKNKPLRAEVVAL